MTHAPHFPAGMMHVQLSAAVLDDGRFVASASSAHSRIAAIVAGSAIATTVSLSPDTPCCSSAPSDALVETPFRIPSTDTLGFAAAALAASCLACYPVVDSVDELLDLDQGSWEGSLPDSSSLGEDGTPLRGAFINDSASLTGFQELTAGKTLSILREWRILIAIDLRQPGPLWSAKLAQSYAAADTESCGADLVAVHPRFFLRGRKASRARLTMSLSDKPLLPAYERRRSTNASESFTVNVIFASAIGTSCFNLADC